MVRHRLRVANGVNMGLFDNIFGGNPNNKPAVKAQLETLRDLRTGISFGAGEAQLAHEATLFSEQAWYFACMVRRAGGIASIPTIYARRNGKNEVAVPFEANTRSILFKVELDWLTYGQSFLLGIANRSGVVRKIRHVAAQHINMTGNGRDKPYRYERNLGTGKQVFYYDGDNWLGQWGDETLVLMPLQSPSHLVEDDSGAAGIAHGKVGALDGNVLRFINIVLNDHFGAGSLNRVYATSDNPNMPVLGDTEHVKGFKAYLNRVLRGSKNSQEIHVLNSIDFKTIPSDLASLQIPKMEETKQEDICVAFETPRPIVVGDMTNRGDDDNLYKSWMSTVMIPRHEFITEAINAHLVRVSGFRILAQPDKMKLFQNDIKDTFDALHLATQAGVHPDTAAKLLNLELPEGYTLTGGQIGVSEPVAVAITATEGEAPQEQTRNAPEFVLDLIEAKAVEVEPNHEWLAELHTLKRWADNRIKRGKELKGFTPDVMTSDEVGDILFGTLAAREFSVKQFETGDETANRLIARFEEESAELHRELQNGEIEEEEHKARFDTLIAQLMTALFVLSSGTPLEDASPEAVARLNAEIEEQQGFTAGIVADLKDGRYSDNDEGLQKRVALWAFGLGGMFALGKTWGPDDRILEWRLGQTEEHCSTCLALHGQRKTAKEWREFEHRPQGRTLECGGYHCDCGYYEVD